METTYDKDGLYLGRLADVFGDPTRRGIYRHLRACETPQSASEVADVFGLHRTVARAHLEKLTEMDLVSTATRRRPGAIPCMYSFRSCSRAPARGRGDEGHLRELLEVRARDRAVQAEHVRDLAGRLGCLAGAQVAVDAAPVGSPNTSASRPRYRPSLS